MCSHYLGFVAPSIITSNSFSFPLKFRQACLMVDNIKWDHITCSFSLGEIRLSPNSWAYSLAFLSEPNVTVFHIFYLFPTSPQKKHNGSLYDFDGIYMKFLLKTLHRYWDAVFSPGWFILHVFSITTRNSTTNINFIEDYEIRQVV